MRKLFRREAERNYPAMSVSNWLAQLQQTYSFNGHTYTLPVQTTMPGQKAEGIGNSFEGYVQGGLAGNGVIFGLASVRMRVFSEARFQFQRMRGGRPGDYFGTTALSILEQPWPGGTTGDLLAAALLHADFAGNAYIARIGAELVLLRPDWVDILLGERLLNGQRVGMRKVGYAYYEGGRNEKSNPAVFAADEVAHFCPQRDPLAWYRGMSWLTPVVREIQADGAATQHKLSFFENAATPNLAVSLPKELTPAQFYEFVDAMDEKHKGAANAYKTLYTGGGADVTVIGADMQQLDFKVTQGAGETRLAQAAGVPPVVAGLSEGLQGSSLNAGNFGQARRQFADTTLSHLWRNFAGSISVLIPSPPDTRLWFDSRDIPFLREDQKDGAVIQQTQAQSIKQLIDAGYTPESCVAAITNNDFTLLEHTGLFSVQLQPPGSQELEPAEEQLALPPGREDFQPVFNIAVDARTNVERGAINLEVGNIDNSTGLDREDLSEAFEQLQLPVPEVRVEAPVVNMPAFPELPAPIVNVEAPSPRAMRRTMVRDKDHRIVETIDRYE